MCEHRIFPQRASIMGKKELQWTPLLGQFMTLSGAVFVDRGNNARAVQSLRAAGEGMKQRKTSLWMFPEGTRSMRAAPDLLPFKKGAFHLAVQAGVPIVPVVCENYWRLYRQGVFESGVLKIKGVDFLGVAVWGGADLRYFPHLVLPPIQTADLTTDDVADLAARVREQMLAALREISTPAPASAPVSTPAPASAPSPPAPQPEPERAPRPLSPQDAPKTIVDERVPAVPRLTPSRDASRESLASSSASGSRRQESETGAETEEDEGMVLVGRPGSAR